MITCVFRELVVHLSHDASRVVGRYAVQSQVTEIGEDRT